MYKNIPTQSIGKPLHRRTDISIDVLRLDLMHPIVSGNKWFKLKYHLHAAVQQNKKGIITLGGAYSNHLVATAVACRENNLLSIGIIRGEESFHENDSVKQMKEAGMKIIYVSREQYKNKDQFINDLVNHEHDYYFVPEGGQSAEGIKGAAEIISFCLKKRYTDIMCSVGTGTTLAGLVNASENDQQIVGISALKIAANENNDLKLFLKENTNKTNYKVIYDYHFGGYAKKNNQLITFMNELYLEEKIATDFVYTGKMFYAVYDLIKKDYFVQNAELLLIHSGGLQGNRSLPEGMLVF
jgi:1-aminocyclopropane-1-carboxylate deaminase